MDLKNQEKQALPITLIIVLVIVVVIFSVIGSIMMFSGSNDDGFPFLMRGIGFYFLAKSIFMGTMIYLTSKK